MSFSIVYVWLDKNYNTNTYKFGNKIADCAAVSPFMQQMLEIFKLEDIQYTNSCLLLM